MKDIMIEYLFLGGLQCLSLMSGKLQCLYQLLSWRWWSRDELMRKAYVLYISFLHFSHLKMSIVNKVRENERVRFTGFSNLFANECRGFQLENRKRLGWFSVSCDIT